MGLVFVLSIAPTAFACLQGHELRPAKFHVPQEYTQKKPAGDLTFPKPEPIKLDGFLGQQPAESPAPMVNLQREEYLRYVARYEARPKAAKRSLEERTDYAVALIFLGHHRKAIDALVALERDHPGVYATAANLGTAYELVGDLKNALKWIEKGIERNAASHQGTEWLHLAILRAKINLAGNPAWLAEHTVLEGNTNRSADEIMRAIAYQLEERLQFVQPLDPVICDLFYQFALRLPQEAAKRRAQFAEESLRFGEWRKAEVAALTKS